MTDDIMHFWVKPLVFIIMTEENGDQVAGEIIKLLEMISLICSLTVISANHIQSDKLL